LLILRGAIVSRTAREWAHHPPMAEEAGVGAAQMAALPAWHEATCFDARERTVLQLADEVTVGPGATRATMTLLRL
jgi:alkylhydroperoxidase family enzyme